jgi:hypothetical protein
MYFNIIIQNLRKDKVIKQEDAKIFVLNYNDF